MIPARRECLFVVVACLGAGCPRPAVTTLPCPGQISPPEVGVATRPGSVTLSWEGNAQARGYRVYRADLTDDEPVFIEVGTAEGPVFVDDTVVSDRRYHYRVHGLGEGCEAPAHVNALAFGPPNPPDDLFGLVFSEVGIALSWDDTNRYESAYGVEIHDEAGFVETSGVVDASTLSLNLGGFTHDTRYTIRVGSLVETSVEPVWSSPLEITTWPFAVDELAITALSHSEVEISWEHYNDYGVEIRVERQPALGVLWNEVARLPIDEDRYLDTGLNDFEFFRYRVTVVGETGASAGRTVEGSAFVLPQMQWTGAPTVNAASCVVRVPGEHRLDLVHEATYVGASATAMTTASGEPLLGATGLFNGVDVALDGPFLGTVDVTWRVEDSLGGATEIARSLRLEQGEPVDTRARGLPSAALGDDAAEGRQPLLQSADHGAVACDRACFGRRGSLALGPAHTCVLDDEGGVRCFGAGGAGRLGAGDEEARLLPAEVCSDAACSDVLKAVVQIAAGDRHTCAVVSGPPGGGGAGTTSSLRCWGAGEAGQLGGGTVTASSSWPLPVCSAGEATTGCDGGASLLAAVQVATGENHTCAVTPTGEVACFGAGDRGQLGDALSGAAQALAVPVCASGAGPGCPTLAGVVQVAAGSEHTCALLGNGTVRCWGRGDEGQLGDGQVASGPLTPHDVLLPTPVLCGEATGAACPSGTSTGELRGVIALAAGDRHTCALLADGAALCWGRGEEGQLGDDQALTSPLPVRVCTGGAEGCASGLLDVVALAAGGDATGLLLGSGEARCTGTLGGAPDAVTATVPLVFCDEGLAPTCAEPPPTFSGLDVGGGHACGASSGGLTCLGQNDLGQLGRGEATTSWAAPGPVCASDVGVVCPALTQLAERRCAPLVAVAAGDDGP